MTHALGLLSLVPPLVAISLAFLTKRIIPSLLAGVFAAVVLLHLGQFWLAPFRTLDYMAKVASDIENLELIAFSVVVGALLKLIRDANGFATFAHTIERLRKNYGRGTVYGVTFTLSSVVFLECWSNILISGTTMAPLYDRLGISRQRLAYFIHTIGLNIVAMVVINGWGAFYLSVLRAQNVSHPFNLIISAMPFNLYSWISLALVVVVMVTGLTIGPMKKFEAAAQLRETTSSIDAHELDDIVPPESATKPKLAYLFLPVATLIVTMVTSLYSTGHGDITRGDGSASILYAAALATGVLAVKLLIDRVYSFVEIEQKILAGMREFFDVSLLIVIALSLGGLCKDIGTGPYISQIVQATLPTVLVPAMIFIGAAVMSFATGTSYGTLAIMVPIVLPMSAATGLGAPLLFAATLSGAIFGDNTSPINDNAIITSMASGATVLDHVRSQMPYALIAATLSVIGFVILAAFRTSR
ncbi:MAG: Na+/H+ antiporter NhaC family protein [Rhodanobacter sp.]